MKVYLAGPLCTKVERENMEKIDEICKELGLRTFLPHRDCGLWKNMKDTKRIAEGDIKGFEECGLLIANLNGFGISPGTAWEMGYAHAKGIPVIGIKTDKKIDKSIGEMSAIIVGSTKIVNSIPSLKKEIKILIKRFG